MTEVTLKQRFRCPCELLNVVPPKSFDRKTPLRGLWQSARTPPPTFLFLSSLVKEQHQTMRASKEQQASPDCSGHSAGMSMEAAGAIRRKRRRRRWTSYRPIRFRCQQRFAKNFAARCCRPPEGCRKPESNEPALRLCRIAQRRSGGRCRRIRYRRRAAIDLR